MLKTCSLLVGVISTSVASFGGQSLYNCVTTVVAAMLEKAHVGNISKTGSGRSRITTMGILSL